LQILNPSDYKNEIKGSIKCFYGKYPYKARLKSNNVALGLVNLEIYEWFRYKPGVEIHTDELKRVMGCKFVNSFTRHAYFTEKSYLDEFVNLFEDSIDEIQGPINKDHADALQKVNSQTYNSFEMLAIRDRLYYKNFDARITFNYKPRPRAKGSMYAYPRVLDSYREMQQWFRDLQNYVADIVGEENCVLNYNNVYLNADDTKDVAMYMKLKYPDAIRNITKIIVIENLNNR